MAARQHRRRVWPPAPACFRKMRLGTESHLSRPPSKRLFCTPPPPPSATPGLSLRHACVSAVQYPLLPTIIVMDGGRGPTMTVGERPPHAIRWLHVPKAGSALINVVARFGCRNTSSSSLLPSLPSFDIAMNFTQWRSAHPEARCAGVLSPWAGHAPVQKHETHGSRVLVGVFRKPAQRLLSGFHHREDGRPNSMIAPGAPLATRAAMRRACRGDPGAYARWPGIGGCATKMLLGRACASTYPLDATHVSRAVRVLRERFAFVGLLEHWAISVCTFHAILLDGAPIDPLELRPTHAGPHRPAAKASAGGGFVYDERALRGFVDEADEAVYAAASARFWADARRTGCAQRHVDAEPQQPEP